MRDCKVYAVIVAAGKGLRVGSSTPKQLLRYGKSTVLGHTLSVFACHKDIDEIVIVSPADGTLDEVYRNIAAPYSKTISVVRGGAERSDSVQAALNAIKGAGADDNSIVMIHDAARPGVDDEIINRNIEAMSGCEAVVTCLPSVDSVRIISEESLKEGAIYPIMKSDVVERRLIYNVQTPQTFRFGAICSAYEKANACGYVGTDDASVASFAGMHVSIVEGSPSNSKITTAKDVPMTTRVGTGYDVHRLVSGRDLILCGTPVPNDKGLLGHSDADVATHAIMDALLGAAGKGDIGIHFPDTDEKYKGANSLELLREVKKIIGDYVICNVDVTIVCQRPKLAPYRDSMRKNIADTLEIPETAVNVKATTTEGLGFTGEGEGIAAIASCAIEGRI